MERLPGQLSSEDKTYGAQVDWRERITVHYRLIPLETYNTTCLLSECSFAGDSATLVEAALSSTTDYLCLEKACAGFEVRLVSIMSFSVTWCLLLFEMAHVVANPFADFLE